MNQIVEHVPTWYWWRWSWWRQLLIQAQNALDVNLSMNKCQARFKRHKILNILNTKENIHHTPFELSVASPHLFPLRLAALKPLHCDTLQFCIHSRYDRRVDPSIRSLDIHLSFDTQYWWWIFTTLLSMVFAKWQGEYYNLQGGFFNWSALKMTKCQITCNSLQKVLSVRIS